MNEPTATSILDFWFSNRAQPLHFKKDSAFDSNISQRFLPAYEAAAGGKLAHWEQTPTGSLASVILLDQFPRNMFRHSAKCFATDDLALKIAANAVNSGDDEKLGRLRRHFLYMPFMHSESAENQEISVRLYRKLGARKTLKYAEAHRDIIAEFGRFPHRNDLLGRASTPKEIAFLKEKADSGF